MSLDLTTIEIAVWIILTIFLIVTPLAWLVNQRWPHIIEFISTVRNVERGTHEQKEHTQTPQPNTTETKTPEQHILSSPVEPKKDIVEQVKAQAKEKQEQETKEEIPPPQATKKREKEPSQDTLKFHKEIENIKFAALASKERGNLDNYEKKLIEGLALSPDYLEFLKLLSTHYFENGQHIKSLSLLKKVVNIEPENHKAIRQISQIYVEQDQVDTAELLLEKAISLKNDHPKYYISLVEIYYQKKELTKAIQTMEKILKLRPTNTDYLITVATLYEEAKKPTLAEKYFKKVLEIDPANIAAKKGIKNLI